LGPFPCKGISSEGYVSIANWCLSGQQPRSSQSDSLEATSSMVTLLRWRYALDPWPGKVVLGLLPTMSWAHRVVLSRPAAPTCDPTAVPMRRRSWAKGEL
jgi:hypothetical protein